jgi:hypothetical protein
MTARRGYLIEAVLITLAAMGIALQSGLAEGAEGMKLWVAVIVQGIVALKGAYVQSPTESVAPVSYERVVRQMANDPGLRTAVMNALAREKGASPPTQTQELRQ